MASVKHLVATEHAEVPLAELHVVVWATLVHAFPVVVILVEMQRQLVRVGVDRETLGALAATLIEQHPKDITPVLAVPDALGVVGLRSHVEEQGQ